MSIQSCEGTSTYAPKENDLQITFMTTGSNPSWEMWHRRFGHISYDGLQKLLQKNMVNGFEVSKESAPSDCVTCVEAKMTVDSYKTVPKRHQKPGELTHIDVWGNVTIRTYTTDFYLFLHVLTLES